MPVKIYVAILPLHQELVKQQAPDFMKENDFIRLCNEQSWIDIYSESVAEEAELRKNNEGSWDFLFSGDADYNDVFTLFLNKLWQKYPHSFPTAIVEFLQAFLIWTDRYIVIDKILLDLNQLELTEPDKDKLLAIWKRHDSNVARKVAQLKSHLIAHATAGSSDKDQYSILRKSLMGNTGIDQNLPDFVKKFRTLDDFWPYIKTKFPTYAERRTYINEAFSKLEDQLEAPVDAIVASIEIDNRYVHNEWAKASERLKNDPEAAITSARTLIETVCKHILDIKSVNYDDTSDLPQLYKLTAQQLNLSPDQHTEQIFKQILSGCSSIVSGLGSLRNKLGDAHGKSQNRGRPLSRHAALAVNIAGAVAQFLIQTFEAKNSNVVI